MRSSTEITPPDCPRPSHTTIGDYQNTPSTDYGCAFVGDAEAMSADPARSRARRESWARWTAR
jgi:hypothetical protein